MNPPAILLLLGPNLDLSGQRDPAKYGTDSMDDHIAIARQAAVAHGYALDAMQSASEAKLVRAIHEARGKYMAVIINAGAFTHYAWSLRDALELFAGPIVEVHLSHPVGREPWRHRSVVAPVATASITGCGSYGYELAVQAIRRRLQ